MNQKLPEKEKPSRAAAVRSVENAVTLPVPRWEMMRALFMLEVIVAREQRMLTALWDASGTPSSR